MSFQIQNIKSEPLEKEAEEFSNIFFDYENKIPIKEEIKQEIKIEPFVNEYNMDVENHVTDVENDQDKSDLLVKVDKILIDKQTLQKDMKNLMELRVENQILKSENDKLQVENQNLKCEKNYTERQLEDQKKKFQELSLQFTQLQSTVLNSNKKIEIVQKPSVVHESKIKKTGGNVDTITTPQVRNVLEASAPTKRRGKEREKPKRKKPTTLKKLILQDREKRNLERQLNLILSAEKQKDIETVLIVDQKPEIVSNSDDLAKNIHENILKEPQIIELPQHSVQEKAKLQIHSRKFRR